ncbi:MAG: branched-chain amino acid ABC transporter permease [Verrucomicrobia bacterium]|nr:branched-chain amino acid ABC transporter permease [Verrucomicrobiota bacterium]
MEQFLANGLCKGALYALVAMGFGLIYTTSGVFHLAHGAVYSLAAYALYCCLILAQVPLPYAIAATLIAAIACGLAIETIVYRPLAQRGATGAVLLISSLGVYIIIVNLLAMFLGNETRILRSGVERTVMLGDAILTRVQLAQLIVAILTVTSYWMFLRRSSLGRICRAVADDPVLASVIGIKVEATRLLVFGIGSFLAAVAAILAALDLGIDPHIGFPVVLLAAVACIIGGLHRFIAPALGGVLLGVTQSLVVWKTSAKWESAVTFALLICFLLFRPQGLLGMRVRLEEK